MAALSRPRKQRPPTKLTALWFERIMALIAVVNLGLVLFDVSYIRFRDFYLRFFPDLTEWYGETYKGIQPERTTVNYLETVEDLKEQVAQTGLQSVQAKTLLADLREQSEAIIDENPFQVANKSGTLEQIKNLMRDRVGLDSAKEAFNTFWSEDYLSEEGGLDEITYFESEIKPLIETNYFRPIGEDGAPLDLFWTLDIWFVGIFALELFARSVYISNRYRNTNLLDAVLLRWYDLFLVMPFWRWLRAIPVLIRVNQSQLVNLIPLRNRINRVFITNFAVELTEIVVLRIIDQVQNLLREGKIASWVLGTNGSRRYIDLNDIDEVQTISQRLSTLLIYQVLPQIKPELDALLHHSLTNAFYQTSGYQSFRRLPGVGSLPDQIVQQVIAQTSQNLYRTLTSAMEDEQGAELTQALVERLGSQFRTELQQEGTLEEMQNLLIVLLDEIKINYVKQVATEDVERLMEESYRIYNITQERQ